MEAVSEHHSYDGKSSYKVHGRKNILQEKRRMRAKRKKRKRAINACQRHDNLQNALETVSKLQSNIKNKDKLLEKSLNKMQMYKNMSRSYWERRRWELQKRKELLGIQHSECLHESKSILLNINPAMLNDLYNGTNMYVSRGSFGVVKLKLYHGIYVAVK